ncbi:EAL domain-containing protein [Lachnospiraceae bacterium JC7]|nr:EAL domain-containing protein [Lachnospiraceae bacterium JC7]
MYLQPVVRTLSERVCGYEALARWIDPIYGFISPGDFVPILEDNGLSYRLDTFVVKRVAEIQSRNADQGIPIVPISVNISRSDFDNCSPVDVITGALDEYGLRRNCICVEITETALMNNEGIIKQEIGRFNEAGIEVWMDDFGSGFSSLNLLKDYNFDEIKLDMLFLRDFSEKSKVIMTMAVKMAKELGIHTLAEGVENEEQIEFLKSIGCEKIQGYYYSKPLPINELNKYLSKQGLMFETREEKSVYEKTGLIDVVTQQALGLVFLTV